MREKFICKSWKDYELIDCGGEQKLERFGEVIFIRPETNAKMERVLSYKEWEKMAHIEFKQTGAKSGKWIQKREIKSPWMIDFPLEKDKITLELNLTKFKHIGIFPEQALNWEFIYQQLQDSKLENPKFLNLFAYTGGASLAAKAAGASVTHVDSIKQVVQWAKRNMEHSKLSDIRWLIDDAHKFIKKEIRRGNTYDFIVMDPPSYGRGPKGEVWKFENEIDSLLDSCSQIMAKNSTLLLNTYSGFSHLEMKNLITKHINYRDFHSGVLYLQSSSGNMLPTGFLNRIQI